MLIDGQWVPGAEGRTIERVAPSHGVTVSRYQSATKVDAERAIAAARKAFDDGPWPRMTASQRSAILLKAADLIAARAEELAYLDAIEAGKPISQVRGEIGGSVDIWRYAAGLASMLDQLGIAQVDVVGHSYGGAIAARLALDYPERVRRVVFINSPIYYLEPSAGERVIGAERRQRQPARE